MNENLDIDKNGLDFIKKWEGCILSVYRDIANLKTVGIGHLITPKEDVSYPDGKKITEDEAYELLHSDVQQCVKRIKCDIKVKLNQNQFNALCSFGFNCGVGVYQASEACKLLNLGDYDGFCSKLLNWSKTRINGVSVTVTGLLNRRKNEVELFKSPIEVESDPSITLTDEEKECIEKQLNESSSKMISYAVLACSEDGI